MLTAALAKVEASWIAGIVGSTAVYPFMSALHLLGIALLVGSIVPVDLRLLRVLDARLDDSLPILVRIAWIGFALAALSGALLASVRLSEYSRNPALLAKFGLIVAAGLNVMIFHHATRSAKPTLPSNWRRASVAGGASLLCWLGALLAGRLIAFV